MKKQETQDIESLRQSHHVLRGVIDDLHSDNYMRIQSERKRIDKLEDFRGYILVIAITIAALAELALIHFAAVGIKLTFFK